MFPARRFAPTWLSFSLAFVALALGLFAVAASYAQQPPSGKVDPTFGASLGLTGKVRVVTLQPDGKLLVGGSFDQGVARLNIDGTIDGSFNPALVTNVNYVNAIAVQSDGKILLGGFFLSSYQNVPPICLIRLNSDGSLDSTFNEGVNGQVDTMAILPDEQILVGGDFNAVGGPAGINIARLNTDGSRDQTFNASATNGAVYQIALLTDGKVLIGGAFNHVNGTALHGIVRLNPDGSLDGGFNANTTSGITLAMAVQTDGKIIISSNLGTVSNMTRLNADGSFDNTFNATIGNAASNEENEVYAVALQSDGKIIISGNFRQVDGTTQNNFARLAADGALDTSFASNTPFVFDPDNNVIDALAIQSDGKIILGGSFDTVNGVVRNSLVRLTSNGVIDAEFNPDANPGLNREPFALSIQTDGKILIGGAFTQIGGVIHQHLARLNTDSSVDVSFNPVIGSTHINTSKSVSCLATQPDGRIIVGGSFTQVNGAIRKNIARLNPDGTLDADFNPSITIGSGTNGDSVLAVAIQADGKVLVGGNFDTVNGVTQNYLTRLNPDGSLDTEFTLPGIGLNNLVNEIVIQPDGKIIITGYFVVNGTYRVTRLNPDGSFDNSFDTSTDSYVRNIVIQSDGKILAQGPFAYVNGIAHKGIVRLNSDGSPDAGFNATTDLSIPSDDYDATMVLQPDGKIVLGGYITQVDTVAKSGLARLNSDGTLDTVFNAGVSLNDPYFSVNKAALQPDGTIIITGNFTSVNGIIRNYVARLNADGTLDLPFNPGVGAPNVNAVIVVPSATSPTDPIALRVLIGGSFTSAGGQSANALARLRSDGSLDPTFTAPFSPGDTVPALALQTDGNVVVSQLTPDTTSPRPAPDSRGRAVTGPHTDTKIKNPIVRCLGVNGSLDTTFSAITDGTASSLSLQTNGQIVIGGSFTMLNSVGHPNLGRLNANGTLDNNFAASTNAAVQVVLAQSDGHIAVGGLFTQVNAAAHPGLARLNADGTLDATFSSTAGTDGAVLALALQADGKLVAGGSFANASGQPRSCLARFNANGTLDTAFNPGAITRAGGGAQVSSVAQQADGKLVIAGLFSQVGTSTRNNVARLNTDGSVDTTFDPSGGPNAIVRALALQPDGRTLLGGDFTSVNSVQRNAAARLLGDYNLNDYPSLGQWRIVNFGSPSTTGNSADTATPYNDGVPNLLKYALNLNAQRADDTAMTASGTKGLPLVGRDATGQYLTLTFVRRQAATSPGITYLVEFSSALSASGGFAVNPSATSTATALDSTWERVTVTDSVPRSQQSARFVRLRVTDP